ncbi:MAG TPA: hypothetical protein VGM03_06025 [Phycisphaerae bacterium]|jgi:hypothetical protein
MTINRLRDAARAQPFRPFTICLTDGCKLRIPSPECLFIPPDAQRTFIVAEPGSGEDYRILDLLLVTSIDFVNGERRQSRKSR